jgi:hypothetical protein
MKILINSAQAATSALGRIHTEVKQQAIGDTCWLYIHTKEIILLVSKNVC